MTGTPCCLALAMTAAADGESRLTISRTLAPLLSIWSAIVANFALSPLAFWMSESTPAAAKASPRYLRSAVSQRADDAASGRITPTLALAAGVLVAAPPPPLAVGVSSLPHAATPNASTPDSNAIGSRREVFLIMVFPPQGFADGFSRTPSENDGSRRVVRTW